MKNKETTAKANRARFACHSESRWVLTRYTLCACIWWQSPISGNRIIAPPSRRAALGAHALYMRQSVAIIAPPSRRAAGCSHAICGNQWQSLHRHLGEPLGAHAKVVTATCERNVAVALERWSVRHVAIRPERTWKARGRQRGSTRQPHKCTEWLDEATP